MKTLFPCFYRIFHTTESRQTLDTRYTFPKKRETQKMSQPPKRQKSIQMVDEMKEVLECPVCLKVPRRGNVYQCKRGHSICSGCHPHLTMCPICRVAMSKSPARNFAMEKLLSKVTHACKFADHGCIFEEAFGPLESHEQDCEFRLVNCISRVCETQVSLAKLLEHIEEDHKEEEIPSIVNLLYLPSNQNDHHR